MLYEVITRIPCRDRGKAIGPGTLGREEVRRTPRELRDQGRKIHDRRRRQRSRNQGKPEQAKISANITAFRYFSAGTRGSRVVRSARRLRENSIDEKAASII